MRLQSFHRTQTQHTSDRHFLAGTSLSGCLNCPLFAFESDHLVFLSLNCALDKSYPFLLYMTAAFLGQDIYLVGTAHISQLSADLVRETIRAVKPDTIMIEVCFVH